MKSDAVIAGMVGGVIGLLATSELALIWWAVYEDREFDVPFFMPLYTIAVFVAAVLMLAGAFRSRLSGATPRTSLFIAAGISAVAGLLAGSAFGFFGISSSGPPTFFLLFVLPPSIVLIGAASIGTWFVAKGRD